MQVQHAVTIQFMLIKCSKKNRTCGYVCFVALTQTIDYHAIIRELENDNGMQCLSVSIFVQAKRKKRIKQLQRICFFCAAYIDLFTFLSFGRIPFRTFRLRGRKGGIPLLLSKVHLLWTLMYPRSNIHCYKINRVRQ